MLREFEYSLIHFSSGSASTGDGHSQQTDQTMRAKVSKIPIEGTYFFTCFSVKIAFTSQIS